MKELFSKSSLSKPRVIIFALMCVIIAAAIVLPAVSVSMNPITPANSRPDDTLEPAAINSVATTAPAVASPAPATGVPSISSLAAAPLAPFASNLTATKAVAFQNDVDGDGKADPGDTLMYTVTITNNGPDPAGSVSMTDTLDPNLTLVPGSINTSPVAVNDTYTAVGNVMISPNAAQGLLANDFDADSNTFVITAVDTAGTQGQVVVNNTTGSFTFNPNPGFEGSTTFTYTISDQQTPPKTDTGTVTITVAGMIWFVDNTPGANGDGRLNTPFRSFVGGGNSFSALAADDPGDNIFIYSGAGNYTGGHTLLMNQKLIGQGATASLQTITGLVPPVAGSAAL